MDYEQNLSSEKNEWMQFVSKDGSWLDEYIFG